MKTLISTSENGATTRIGKRARATALSLFATALIAVPATASAIVIDFEVGADQVEIGDYYSGLDVLFSGDDIAVQEGGQTGAFEDTPSPITAMLLLRDGAAQDVQTSATLSYLPGFTSVSFWYAAYLVGGAYEVFDEGGMSLADATFAATTQGMCSDGILICDWEFIDLSGFGVATSIVFTGFGNGQVLFDDVTLEPATTPVPQPATTWLLLSGLAGLGALRRRRAAV